MPSIQSTIVLSVVSGIITSSLIFILISLFKGMVIPWYQKVIYQGVNISGAWCGKIEGGHQLITLNLKQSANKIDGTANFASNITQNAHWEPLRVFNIKGTIQDRFISISGNHCDQQRLGVNSFLLEVIGDGRKISGVFTYYSVGISEITSDPIIFSREIICVDDESSAIKPTLKSTPKASSKG